MKQDDERELVLGNKQLLSLFFVAAVLCGVCFAIGYMVGRNTSKVPLPADQQAGTTPQGRRPQADASPESTVPPTEPPVTGLAETKSAETKPAAEADAPQTSAIEPRSAVSEPKADDKKAEVAKPVADDPLAVTAPEAGASYLQVAALPREDAEGMVKTLRGQKFPVIMAMSPKRAFFRVLVGPYRQTVQLSDAKSRLKALGFNGAFVQKQ